MLIQLLVVILVMGIIYLLITELPLPAPFRMAAMVVLVLISVLWLLTFAGVLATPFLAHPRMR